MNRLSTSELKSYRRTGHLTVLNAFTGGEIDTAVQDAQNWAQAEIGRMNAEDKAWYVEGEVDGRPVLRKLDNPVYLRPAFRALARNADLLARVEQIIGPDPQVLFSQLFFKSPGGGGPKPVHQDNFYFGPNDIEGMVTAWIALDDADEENGCLYYADGSNQDPIIPHTAPAGEPFNLLVPDHLMVDYEMTAAPVPRGGVSFHHGNTLHQSSDNQSDRWRRACAIYYANGKTELVQPALSYDPTVIVTF